MLTEVKYLELNQFQVGNTFWRVGSAAVEQLWPALSGGAGSRISCFSRSE